MYGPASSSSTFYRSSQKQQVNNEESWFCLRTAPKHEHLAAKSLQTLLRLETFAPRLRLKKATRRGPVWFVEAMFPSYIFARFSYPESHRQVQYAPGVSSIVRFGDQVIPISEAIVTGLREALGMEEVLVFEPGLEIGDSVQIAGGVFQGLKAVVTQLLPARDRVRVLVEFLGRQIEAEVENSSVLPVESARCLKLPVSG